MHTLRLVQTIVCLSILLTASAGCKKEKEPFKYANEDTANLRLYDFAWSPVPMAGKLVKFYSTAPATSKHSWHFGYGNTSSQLEPSFSFVESGTYPVTLIVDNDIKTKITKHITIIDQLLLSATGGPCEGDIFYMDHTPYPDASTFAWDFGDGTTSTLQKPHHIYSKAGTYRVTLTINNYHTAVTVVYVYKDPLYTHKTGSMRKWHIHELRERGGTKEAVNHPDEMSELKFVDKVTVDCNFSFSSSRLTYNEKLSKGDILVYGNQFDLLYFDPIQDTMCYKYTYGPNSSVPYSSTMTARTP